MSPASRFGCGGCTDCASFLVELRATSGSYADANSSHLVGGPYSYLYPTTTFTHLATYAWRTTTFFADGGPMGPPSAEQFITADTVAPSPPGVPSVTQVDGGTFRVTFAPATDDGSGPVYSLSYGILGRGPASTEGALSIGVPDLFDTLGPGEWEQWVTSFDAAGNYGGRTQLASTIVIAADPTVAPPAPPVVDDAQSLVNGGSLAVTLTDPADTFHLIGMEADGGLFAFYSARFGLTGPPPYTIYGWLPRECTFRLLASRVVGGKASGWSQPSAPFRIDIDPPTAPAFLDAALDGGVVQLAWGASTDSCSGLDHYALERSAGGPWTALGGALTGTAFVDPLPGSGVWQYRVSAVDQATHSSAPTLSPQVAWLVEADGGTAGPQRLAIGCDCGSGAPPVLVAVALLMFLVRRRWRRA